MKPRQLTVIFGLLVLALAALVSLTVTSGREERQRFQKSKGEALLVDEQPLRTARAMAGLGSSPEEQQFADEALRLGDHEIDLAFADALRDATNHPVPPTPATRVLYAHLNKAEQILGAGQAQVEQLKKQIAATSGDRQDSLQQQFDLAQAQLELDQDELDDAQEDLIRSSADKKSLVQRQFNAHEASEHQSDTTHPAIANNSDLNYRAGDLFDQFNAWHGLRAKVVQLLRAHDDAANHAADLDRDHDSLEKQVAAEKTGKAPATPALDPPDHGQAIAHTPVGASTSAIAGLKRLSDDQRDLSDFDKRIQDQQQLRDNYASWAGLIASRELIALRGMMRSALWIVLVLLIGYSCGVLADRFLSDATPERAHLNTLRIILRFALQVVSVLLILFVLFGAPSQMPTILGLAGAGLTVALKDFIVGFVGWFVLMGRNGIHVGDWVEINGVVGEVVEIGLLRTVLLETGNWTDTGHPTGRKVAFVNSFAIEGHFFNFSTTGQWLWDELQVVVPTDQDPYPMFDAIQKLVASETEANVQTAQKEWQQATSEYRIQSVSATTAVNLRPTASGVEVHVRYITRAKERYATRARLSQALVELLHQRAVDPSEKQSLAAAR
jgi:small-conductance mechanosensitive channel